MSETTPPEAEQAKEKPAAVNPPSGIQLTKPLDEMSRASVAVVADAAAIIAQQKLEAATKAAEAARAALARVAALKAGHTPPEAPDVVESAATLEPVAEAKTSETKAPEPIVVIENPKPEPLAETVPKPLSAEAVAAAPSLPDNANPEDIARLAEQLRAAMSAQRPKRKKPKGKRSLDPVAGVAGLYHPPKQPRKIITPGLVFLLLLMAFYALYASGNLPEFDRWTDSMANSAHAHNDQVVASIIGSWKIILFFAGIIVAIITGVLINNNIRQRQNDDHNLHSR